MSSSFNSVAHQIPLSMEFPSQEYWSGFPDKIFNPGIKPRSSALQADSVPTEPLWKLPPDQGESLSVPSCCPAPPEDRILAESCSGHPEIGWWDASRKHLPMDQLGFPRSTIGKESVCNAGDLRLIPGLGRSPGEGNGNRLPYSCLENIMDREAWQATVHGVAKSGT